ncbi:molybdopterin-dependent oxidoreductase [Enterobacter cloacae]|uniref:molybdopterin-dependent oxidoreductase n=1 Tax=Enterobacter cloacae TaxID=550 RepID=UPI002FFC0694
MKKLLHLSDNEKKYLIRDAEKLISPGRRRLLSQGLTLGGIMMLTGCDISDDSDVELVLSKMSRFNDRVQQFLFNKNILAPEFTQDKITHPFPFNAYYGQKDVPLVDGNNYRLDIRGLVQNTHNWTLAELNHLPQIHQITRHICVEGWSAIGRWGGIPFKQFLMLIGADIRAKYVRFQCADDYYTSIDMASALHPQTILALKWDGHVLPKEYGYPLKLRIPTKLGYKNPKHIISIEVTNRFTGGYWEDQGYNWFGGS